MPETDSDLTADTQVIADTDMTADTGVIASADETADTAHFRAFAARRDDDLPAPWQMRAGGSKIGVLAVAVVVVALLAVVLGALLLR